MIKRKYALSPISFCFLMGLFFLVPSLSLFAQPTLTVNNHTPQVGEVGFAINCTLGSIGPGPSGPNQNWDFSNCDTTGSGEVADLVLASSPQATFPAADVLIISGLTLSSLTTDNMEINIIGQEGILFGDVLDFSDPMTIMRFPMTFGTTFLDSFSGLEISQFDTTPMLGTILIEADGYGDIVTPAGSFTNVLRKKEDIIKTYYPPNGPAEIHETITYYWYQPGIHFPIFLWREDLLDGVPLNSYGRMYTRHTVDIEEEIASELISLFPNPCSGKLNIHYQMKTTGAYTITLCDMQGKQILAKRDLAIGQGMVKEQIDLTGIERGVYLVQFESDEGVEVQRLMVE